MVVSRPPDIDSLIATYLTACAVEGKSPNTLSSYRASLADFRRAGQRLGFPPAVGDYDVSHVYQYLNDIRARGGGESYQHRRHREVKTFFSWCRRFDFVGDNAFARVPLNRLEQRIVQPFSPREILALLAVQDTASHHDNRNYALILFLLDTGVRASECISVGIEDIDWEGGRIRVLHGKGRKQRWVAMSARTAAALSDYISRFRGSGPGALFLGSRSQRPIANASALHLILGRIAKRAGVTHVHPHRFRHTFATWAIRAQAREIDVQNLLGHTSVSMVQRYARTYSSEQAVSAHAGFSPVGQLPTLVGPARTSPQPAGQ